jgi:hypothetical protein
MNLLMRNIIWKWYPNKFLKKLIIKVSHHPPITANYAENDNYILYETLNAGGPPKFLGNSLEFPPLKLRHVKLKKYDDVISI